jgi:hypothetical protein
VRRIALYEDISRRGAVRARELKQAMLWHFFRNMTDDDLKAIFAYLKTLKPVKHVVDNAEPPTLCTVCKSTHGGGDKNQRN